jgi:D-beta-D-heptose 7-phosphate kinase/D-beta-D-heptose 1-phosphate adenosyltransferase
MNPLPIPPDLNFFDRLSVLVVGDAMLDRYQWGSIRRISPEAPVPIVDVERETHTAGGAANAASNLAALGVRCELFGVIGDDAAGEELRALLQQRQVIFDPRLVRSAATTITKTRIVAQRQQICRLDKESKPETYSLGETGLLGLLAEKAAHYDAVILSDYAKGVVSQPVIDTLRQVRMKYRTFLALDPKPVRPLEIGGLDLLTPNHGEGLQLSGLVGAARTDAAAAKIAAAIIERHQPECLVMTLGENGMLLRTRRGVSRHFPTRVRQVADLSGAGDTVIATLTAALAAGIAPEEAVAIANLAAGVVVEKLGTATVTRQELRQAFEAARLFRDGSAAG